MNLKSDYQGLIFSTDTLIYSFHIFSQTEPAAGDQMLKLESAYRVIHFQIVNHQNSWVVRILLTFLSYHYARWIHTNTNFAYKKKLKQFSP